MMDFALTLLFTGASFFYLALLFRPLEKVFPEKKEQDVFTRPGAFTDLCFFLGQYLFWNGILFSILVFLKESVAKIFPPFWFEFVASQPLWLQMIEVIVLSDFFVYWGHRIQHRVDFLWRFHAIHHSAEELDWLAAHREHPVDAIYTMSLINLPAFLLGFPIETLALFIGFRTLWAIFIHSNVQLPIGKLEMLIGSPKLHHWHHDVERDIGNYANLSPLMDLLFGTYYTPEQEELRPKKYGLKQPIPKSYLGLLLFPFKR